MRRLELALYLLALAALSTALLLEGRRSTALLGASPVSPKELYALLANPQVKVQVVDLRPHDEENYLDTHIPGALPLPGCAPEQAPAGARERVYPYVTTIIVSADGDLAAFEACRGRFGLARNLAGGQAAWSAANLPEDSGAYSPPRNSSGGGCL